MPDFPFGVQLAPPQEPYKTYADIEAETAAAGVQKLQLRAALDKSRKQQLLQDTIKKHVTQGPDGSPVVDHKAVTQDLYLKDPELGQAYEDDLTDRQAKADAAKQAALKTSQENNDYQLKKVRELVAPINVDDTSQAGQMRAASMYGQAVALAKAHGIDVTGHETYVPDFVRLLREQDIGPKTEYEADARAKAAQATSDAAMKRTQLTVGSADRRAAAQNATTLEAARIRSEGTKGAGGGKNGATTTDDPFLEMQPNNPFEGRFRMTSDVGPRTPPIAGASSNHQGRDYAVPMGTPVPAKGDGTVVSAGPNGGLGNTVRVKFDDGSEQEYGHLSQMGVKPGQRVTRGQVMALTGSSGISTGPHVHVQDFSSADTDPGSIAQQVWNYKGPSRLSKGGEIALRTNADIKLGQTIQLDKQLNAVGNALNVLKAGAATGPGTGVQNTLDRLGMGTRAVTNGYVNLGDPRAQAARVNAYDLINTTATTEAIQALQLIGGNDTDKDFDRALNTTASNLRQKNFNVSTLQTAQALYRLQKDKVAFTQRWASVAGDPNATIKGTSLNEAWDKYAASKMTAIGQLAKTNGLYDNADLGAKKKPLAAASTLPPKPPGAVKPLRNKATGAIFWQMQDGSLQRAATK